MDRVYTFDGFSLAPARRRLIGRDGEAIPLSARAFDVLAYLVEHRGEHVDRERLIEAVWPGAVVEENNLTQAVHAIRRALGDTRGEARYIATIPGRGYRFVGAVTDVDRTDRAPAPQSPAPRPARRWSAIAGAALSAVVAAAVLAVVFDRATDQTPQAAPSNVESASQVRIAVRPFRNLSTDPADAFFAEGLHEDIRLALGQQLSGVDVLSGTTLLSYAWHASTLPQVARDLGATHVFEGSVQREADRIHVAFNLIEARTERVVWAQSYDRTTDSALTLQSDVARDVAGQLAVRLAPAAELRIATTRSPAAYELFLKALIARQGLIVTATRLEVVREIESLLGEAIRLDPSFAAAYAERSRVRSLSFGFNVETNDAVLGLARADLEAAERLAPGDPRVVAARAAFVGATGDSRAALAILEAGAASELADAHWLSQKAILLEAAGRSAEALSARERSFALDPLNPLALIGYAANLNRFHRRREALAIVDFGREQLPPSAAPLLDLIRGLMIFEATGDAGEWTRASAALGPPVPQHGVTFDAGFEVEFARLAVLNRYDELIAYVEAYTPATHRCNRFYGVGDQPAAVLRGWAYLLVNDRDKAAVEGRRALEFVAQTKREPWNDFYVKILEAEAHTFLGDREPAVRAARAALERMPRSADAFAWGEVARSAARVYAWNGRHDEAVALLKELHSATPGMGPALIARDPLFAQPLQESAAYRDFVLRLEASMASFAGSLAAGP